MIAEGGFPKKFSMGALLLMYDMIMDRLSGSAGNFAEELRRRERLIASGGSYFFLNLFVIYKMKIHCHHHWTEHRTALKVRAMPLCSQS